MTNIVVTWGNDAARQSAGDLADQVLATAQTAANSWAGHIQGDSTITVALYIGDVGGAVALGGPHYAWTGAMWEQPPRTLARDGYDPEPGAADIDVTLGTNVVVGPGVEIGRGTVIGANTVIGAGVTIGRNCVIAANTTIDCAHIGNDVVLHSGVRIGTEGFGWLDFGHSNRKIPQLGRVIIQDRVEIGANSTVDRGALGDTVIGEGTKVDNLVQIGHNCRIGRYCLIAAMTGLSGSTIVGDGVLMGGGVGTSGHLSIGDGSVIHGRAAVTKDWPAGSKLAGAPAQDIRDFWRELATMRKLSKGEKRG